MKRINCGVKITDARARKVGEWEKEKAKGRMPYSLAIVLEALCALRMRTLGLHLDAVDCLNSRIARIV